MPSGRGAHTVRACRAVTTLALLGTLAAGTAAAQEPPPNAAAAEVASAFFRAIAQQRWRDAVRYLDPTGLEPYRQQVVAAARRPPHVTTVEELLRGDPDMPRAVDDE